MIIFFSSRVNDDVDSAELELFLERQYLDPQLMSTGKRSFKKRQLQRRLIQAQLSRYFSEFPYVWSFHEGAMPGDYCPILLFEEV